MHILCVHADDEVIGVVVFGSHKCGAAFLERNSMRTQLFACAAMRVTADFVAMESLGVDRNLICKPLFTYKMFHDELSHGGAADVAVADE